MEETLAINQMGENAQPADPPYVHLVQDQMYQVASKLVVVNPAAATSPPSDLWSWAYIVICNLTILDEMETNL